MPWRSIPVHLPARDHRIVAEQHLMHDDRIEGDDGRQADQDQRAHPEQARAFALQERILPGRRQPVDDIAEELEQRHFADGDQHGADRHGQQPGGRRLRVVPAERKQTLRRNLGLLGGIGIEAGFKPAEHYQAPSGIL
jgi:hypothetical protein